jgi:formiminotetrahydrofolate cyclodeaminase
MRWPKAVPRTERDIMRDLTITRFLEQLADRIPAPGGGASAALHAAQAAALTAMVARYSTGEKYAENQAIINRIRNRADALRLVALDLAEKDAAAFGSVAAAYQMPRADAAEKGARSAAIADALAEAAQPPSRVIAVADSIVRLTEELLPIGNPNVITDVAAAAEAARSAAVTAQVNVEVNAAGIGDMHRRSTLLATAGLADGIADRAGKIVAAVRDMIAA